MNTKRDIFIRKDQIGIMPIGALNIAFASYIRGVDIFIESKKPHYIVGKKLKIYLGDKTEEIILTEENYTSDISSLIFTGLPEIILFSPPNHRLTSTLDEVINMICKILEINLQSDDIFEKIPKFVMLSNGIYYEDVLNYITNKFNHLNENIIEEIRGNFIRATSHQTGIRIADENSVTVFKPGSKGNITIAGGSKRSRERVIALFHKFDYPIIDEGIEYRKIEFDKAIINLSVNGVQLSQLNFDEGKIQCYTYGDLISDKQMRDMCKKIIYTMVSIGVKSGIYKGHNKYILKKKDQQDQLIYTIYHEIWTHVEEKSRKDKDHVLSSIATIVERYSRDKLEKKNHRIPPLEENIINYILNLSNENNLVEEKKIIEDLRDSILRICNRLPC